MDNQLLHEHSLLKELIEANGPLIGGAALRRALGYASSEAFRQACFRGSIPIKVFSIPNRRGKFAFTRDVAGWLISLKQQDKESDMNTG